MSIDIYTNITKGCYQNKYPYPTKPSKPDILGKKVTVYFTETDLNEINKYKKDLEKYYKECRVWRQQEGDTMIVFWKDYYQYFGLPKKGTCKFADKLVSIAYDRGHSSGLTDVVNCFNDDMEELWELYKNKGTKNE